MRVLEKLKKSPFPVALLAVAFSGSATQAAEYSLTVADAFPTGHYIAVEGAEYWMNRVGELTDGRVEFQHFTSGQLGSLADMLDMAENRVADITYVPMSSFADRLPLSDVAALPGLFVESSHGSAAFSLLLRDTLADMEFSQFGVSPLWGALLPQYQVASAQGPIRTLADFDRVRLRTPGGTLEVAAQQVGALAVPMGGPEMYTAFERGTVDATVNAFASMNSYKLNEVVNAVSTNAAFGSFAFTYVINADAFAELPSDIQQAMLQAGEETSAHIAGWMDANEATIADRFASEGIEIYQISDEEAARWSERLDNVAAEWTSRLDARGLPGSAVLGEWRAALDQTR